MDAVRTHPGGGESVGGLVSGGDTPLAEDGSGRGGVGRCEHQKSGRRSLKYINNGTRVLVRVLRQIDLAFLLAQPVPSMPYQFFRI